MSELLIKCMDGHVSMLQLLEMQRVMGAEGVERCHWHYNDCRCCVTVHSHDATWVIGRDGESTMFPGRGCECDA